jgi:hypothetical protein
MEVVFLPWPKIGIAASATLILWSEMVLSKIHL